MALFRDATGRPGPNDWVEGAYPKGQDDFPVTVLAGMKPQPMPSLPARPSDHLSLEPGCRVIFSGIIVPVSNFG